LTQGVVFLPVARAELIAAQDWYEKESPGLGARFRTEIDVQIDRITSNPLQFPVLLKDVRRARLRRFPYGLFFRALPEAAFVIACFHSRRDPMVWRER
jgi:plasmid stabilization system protein ParE